MVVPDSTTNRFNPEEAMRHTLSIVLVASALLGGCSYFAVQSAPAKTASTVRTEAATKADEFFWAHAARRAL